MTNMLGDEIAYDMWWVQNYCWAWREKLVVRIADP